MLQQQNAQQKLAPENEKERKEVVGRASTYLPAWVPNVRLRHDVIPYQPVRNAHVELVRQVAVTDELVRAETVGIEAFLCRLGVLARYVVREVVPTGIQHSRAEQSRAEDVRWRSGAGDVGDTEAVRSTYSSN